MTQSAKAAATVLKMAAPTSRTVYTTCGAVGQWVGARRDAVEWGSGWA